MAGGDDRIRDRARVDHLRREVDLIDDAGHPVARDSSGAARQRVLVASPSLALTRYVCQGLSRIEPPVAGFEEHDAARVARRMRELEPALVILDGDFLDQGRLELPAPTARAGVAVPQILLLVDPAAPHQAERRMVSVGASALVWKPFNLSRIAAEATRLLALAARQSSLSQE